MACVCERGRKDVESCQGFSDFLVERVVCTEGFTQAFVCSVAKNILKHIAALAGNVKPF